MRLEAVDLGEHRVAFGALGLVELAEQQVQLARIGLPQEGIELLDQCRDARLLVHRLVGERAEVAAQRGDHPA